MAGSVNDTGGDESADTTEDEKPPEAREKYEREITLEVGGVAVPERKPVESGTTDEVGGDLSIKGVGFAVSTGNVIDAID